MAFIVLDEVIILKDLFFQVYKKLEEEVIDLSYSVLFVDENLIVYSLRIADLISRCNIEIESLVKLLYSSANNKENDSAKECIE